ncbi:hypothetical protein SGLAM104S_09675 [Streptomyces glaucescens]
MVPARAQQLRQRRRRLVPPLLVLPAQPAVPAVPGRLSSATGSTPPRGSGRAEAMSLTGRSPGAGRGPRRSRRAARHPARCASRPTARPRAGARPGQDTDGVGAGAVRVVGLQQIRTPASASGGDAAFAGDAGVTAGSDPAPAGDPTDATPRGSRSAPVPDLRIGGLRRTLQQVPRTGSRRLWSCWAARRSRRGSPRGERAAASGPRHSGGPAHHRSPRAVATRPGGGPSRPIAMRPARAPASASGRRTVVRDGTASMLKGRSSKPATETSSGSQAGLAQGGAGAEGDGVVRGDHRGDRGVAAQEFQCGLVAGAAVVTAVDRPARVLLMPAAASAARWPSRRWRVVVRSAGPAM